MVQIIRDEFTLQVQFAVIPCNSENREYNEYQQRNSAVVQTVRQREHL